MGKNETFPRFPKRGLMPLRAEKREKKGQSALLAWRIPALRHWKNVIR